MTGKVYFVGAGTSADLLTIRAARLLYACQVILHDDLVPAGVLEHAGRNARVINVGKRCGSRGISQETLNAMLVSFAHEYDVVVRLKCGDPSVFSRLGEEMDALTSAGISFEIVPGVTAALAAAAAAKISLTDRRHASEVVFATASRVRGERRDWGAIVRAASTVVIYMPGPNFAKLSGELIASGIPFDLPCAVVSNAGSGREQRTFTTVAELRSSKAPAPAIVIVGEVAAERSLPAELKAGLPAESLRAFGPLPRSVDLPESQA